MIKRGERVVRHPTEARDDIERGSRGSERTSTLLTAREELRRRKDRSSRQRRTSWNRKLIYRGIGGLELNLLILSGSGGLELNLLILSGSGGLALNLFLSLEEIESDELLFARSLVGGFSFPF